MLISLESSSATDAITHPPPGRGAAPAPPRGIPSTKFYPHGKCAHQ
nr:MAG TPA: hypothetical protein [Caudoviricetes sp.]